jgi:uncharacterized protein (DUF58 family)
MSNNNSSHATNSGINVSVQELITLRNDAFHVPLSKVNKWLTQTGQNLTHMRGRGVEFDTTREYQAGDDIRSMAWRVTARSLKPHVKMYHEEKERPIWLALDLSPSLYFGTRCMFKSVSLIKQAARLGWSYLLERERVGALIGSEGNIQIFQPQANERHFLMILQSLATVSRLQPAFSQDNYLQQLLFTLQHKVRSGNLVYLLSDFLQFSDESQKIIAHLAQRAQVILSFVYDPFEAEPPPPNDYVITDGQQRVLFNMTNKQNRHEYREQFAAKKKLIEAFSRKHNIGLKLLCTDQQVKGIPV